jgi:hypothetical protein
VVWAGRLLGANAHGTYVFSFSSILPPLIPFPLRAMLEASFIDRKDLGFDKGLLLTHIRLDECSLQRISEVACLDNLKSAVVFFVSQTVDCTLPNSNRAAGEEKPGMRRSRYGSVSPDSGLLPTGMDHALNSNNSA